MITSSDLELFINEIVSIRNAQVTAQINWGCAS